MHYNNGEKIVVFALRINLRLPQLVAELKLRPSVAIASIISHVGESNEQQVLYAIAALQPLDFILENVCTGNIH